MNTQLLCTFSDVNCYTEDIKKVTDFYQVIFSKIYILQNTDDLDKLLLTYNINPNNLNINGFYKDTISVHRKKDYNTIYTINSLNALVKDLNGGIADSNYVVDWNLYRNCILLTSDNGYRIIPTKLYKIMKI